MFSSTASSLQLQIFKNTQTQLRCRGREGAKYVNTDDCKTLQGDSKKAFGQEGICPETITLNASIYLIITHKFLSQMKLEANCPSATRRWGLCSIKSVKVPQVQHEVFIALSEDFEVSPSVCCLGRVVRYEESLPHLPNAACVANSPENTALWGRTLALQMIHLWLSPNGSDSQRSATLSLMIPANLKVLECLAGFREWQITVSVGRTYTYIRGSWELLWAKLL